MSILEKAEHTPDYRHIINVPPGTMKTLIFVFYRAWLWARNPALRFLYASYSDEAALDPNVKLRTIVQSDWYRKAYPTVELVGDQNAKQRFDTTMGGYSLATSVGGVGTGKHPDYIFIDDPLKEVQARSDVERKGVNAWVDGTLSTRGVIRDVRMFLIMQRLHEDDPAGHLGARGGWRKTVFPMRYEGIIRYPDGRVEKPDPLDHRTEAGELLWPEAFTEEKVTALELSLGPYGTAGQLQQRPAPERGGLFRREWFEILDAMPVNVRRRKRGWDTGATEGAGDPTVGVKMAELPDDTYVIEDIAWAQTDDPYAYIQAVAQMDGTLVGVRIEREGGSAGKASAKSNAKLLKGFDYEPVIVSKDKVTRAKPFRTQCQAGNVKLLRGEWNERFIQELIHFPTGKHDDQVDAASCAFNALMVDEVVVKPKGGTWGGKLVHA